MKYSHKLYDAVFVLIYIYIYRNHKASSNKIAHCVVSNPSMVRNLLSQLTKARLLISQPGKCGRKLAKPIDHISLLDIYRALDVNRQFLHLDPSTNPKCVISGSINKALNKEYLKVQSAGEKEMSRITLQEIIHNVLSMIKNK